MTGFGKHSFETSGVQFVFTDPQQVAGWPGLESLTVLLETAPQIGYVALDYVAGRLRWFVSPEFVDQPVGGHDPIGMCGQQRQNFSLSRPAERDEAAVIVDFKRAQDADFHTPTLGSGRSVLGQ